MIKGTNPSPHTGELHDPHKPVRDTSEKRSPVVTPGDLSPAAWRALRQRPEMPATVAPVVAERVAEELAELRRVSDAYQIGQGTLAQMTAEGDFDSFEDCAKWMKADELERVRREFAEMEVC